MKVSQHTPGPWRADEFYCGYVWSGDKMVADFPMDEDEGTYIARMRGVGRGASREEQHANARLIAAAPELLAALKACSFRLAVLATASGPRAADERAIDAATAAINKAEGRA